jgi:hypothetical protein
VRRIFRVAGEGMDEIGPAAGRHPVQQACCSNRGPPTAAGEFQPIWGILRGLPSEPVAGMGLKRPGSRPRPAYSPNSSLASNIICMPTQMPRRGRLRPQNSRIGSIKSWRLRPAMQSPKAPTPGTTSRSAAATFRASGGTRILASRCWKVRQTLSRLPAP